MEEKCFFCKEESEGLEFHKRDGVLVCMDCYIKNYISEDDE